MRAKLIKELNSDEVVFLDESLFGAEGETDTTDSIVMRRGIEPGLSWRVARVQPSLTLGSVASNGSKHLRHSLVSAIGDLA